MNRDIAYYRRKRALYNKRREYILRHIYCDARWANQMRGRLSKAKTHCSCWMCRYDGQAIGNRRRKLSALAKLME